MDLKKIGNFIANKRKEKELTQDELGKLLNVDRKTISKWENGVYAPDISVLSSLAKTLGITINELLFGECTPDSKGDEISISTINYYNKKYKKRLLMMVGVGLLIIIVSFLIMYISKVKNEYKMATLLSKNDDYYTTGTVIYNSYNVLVYIENIYCDYCGTTDEIKVKDVSVALYLNEDYIETIIPNIDGYVLISKALENIHLSYEGKRNGREPINISLSLYYVDKDNKEHFIIIPLYLYWASNKRLNALN